MVRCRNRRRDSSRGDTFLTSLIFLFVMVGTLRLCFTNTLHESKLTSIFVQETQGYYLLENLMALARDYVYQIVQNPREPHLFLSASAFRTKDKTALASDEDNKDKWIIDFNGSLSKQQIVPDDFPLQIVDNSWDIKGGPIFWQDNKKNENDERYLAEVFMIGSLNLVSNFIPDWTVRTVQMMEIERNPLCDFALYAEGDIGINSNIYNENMYIRDLAQINGNFRCNKTNGVSSRNVYFMKKVNCAGYKLHIDDTSLDNFILPQKYHMLDCHANTQATQCSSSSIIDTFCFNYYKTNYIMQLYPTITTTSHNVWPNGNTSYESFERWCFATIRGNTTFRSRVLRPIGFDPENYWGFWETSLSPQPKVSTKNGETVDQNRQMLNYCFGFHSLAQSGQPGTDLFTRTGSGNYSPAYAMEQLRGLNNYKMTEKARLIEMQKAMNSAAVTINLLTKNKSSASEVSSASLYVPNNFIYSTYMSSAFPAVQDNIYLSNYINLVLNAPSIIKNPSIGFKVFGDPTYKYDYATSPHSTIGTNTYTMCIDSDRLAYKATVAEQNGSHSINVNNIVKLKSTFSPSSSSDDSCPPDALVDNATYWCLDNYVTRITSGEHYNFMYDRNRAKWIQIVDIDISALKTALNADATWTGDTIQPIVAINTYWQAGDDANLNKNYRPEGTDIRYKYASRRESFFESYRNGTYTYPNNGSPVIDIGVRLINATELPTKGLTFYCPYPLYIKGNFNTVNTKPALIITDSITILPSSWNDWHSPMDPINSYLGYNGSSYVNHPQPSAPTIYADIITGRTHPHFWIQSADTTTGSNQTKKPNPDMGFHDAFRSLCHFGTAISLYGSLMLPYFCQEQWEPPIDFCRTTNDYGRDPWVYAYPRLYMFERKKVGIPAGMPFYYRINRGRKTHCLGDTAYNTLIGDTLYNKDWHDTNNTFANYQTALPNYLK